MGLHSLRLAAPISAVLVATGVACGSTGYTGPRCDPCEDARVPDDAPASTPDLPICGPDGTACTPGSFCTCDTCHSAFACGGGAAGLTIDCSSAGPVCTGWPEGPGCDGPSCAPNGFQGGSSGGSSSGSRDFTGCSGLPRDASTCGPGYSASLVGATPLCCPVDASAGADADVIVDAAAECAMSDGADK